MPEEKITLNLEIITGKAGQTIRQIQKIEGTVEDITNELKKLANASSLAGRGLNNLSRQNLASLRKQVSALSSAGRLGGGSVINARPSRGTGTFRSKIVGSQLAERRAAQEQQRAVMREQRVAAAQAARQSRLNFLQGQRRARQSLAKGKRIRRSMAAKAARDRREAQNKRRARIGTVGFLGLSIGQQFGDLFDPVTVVGMIAPNLSKIGAAIGDIFGGVLGQIFKDLTNAVGTLLEGVLETAVNLLKTAFKAIGSFIVSFSIGIITLSFGGVGNVLIGIVGGLVTSVLSIITGLLNTVVNLLKSVLSAITDIIVAGIRIVVSIISAFGKVIMGIWKGIWEGLKAAVESVWKGIEKITKFGIDQLSKGFIALVESERTAAKGAAQIFDITQKLGESFEQSTEEVRNFQNSLRIDYGLEQAKAASGVYFLLSSNFRSVAEAMNVAKASAKLSVVAQEDFNEVGRATANILNAYGLAAKDASRVTRALADGVFRGSFELNELIQSMGTVIGSAAQLKIPLETLVGSFAALSLSGLKANRIGAGLNRMFEAFITPGSQTARTFKRLGVDVEGFRQGIVTLPQILKQISDKLPIEKLREIFPTIQARRAFILAMGNFKRFEGIVEATGKDTKILDKLFDKVSGTFSFLFKQITQIGRVLRENLVKPIAEVLRPILKDISIDFKKIGKVIGDAFTDSEFIGAFKSFLQPLIDEIFIPIKNLIHDITDDLSKTDLKEIFKAEPVIFIRDVFIKIIKIIRNMPKALSEAFGIFSKLKSLAIFIFNRIIRPVLKILSDKGTYVELIISFKKVAAIVRFIGGIFSESIMNTEKLVENFNILFQFLKKAVISFGSFFARILKLAFSAGINFFVATLGAKIKTTFQDVFSDLFGGIENSIKGQIKELKKSPKSNAGQILALKGILPLFTALRKGTTPGFAVRGEGASDSIVAGAVANLGKDFRKGIFKDKKGFLGRLGSVVEDTLARKSRVIEGGKPFSLAEAARKTNPLFSELSDNEVLKHFDLEQLKELEKQRPGNIQNLIGNDRINQVIGGFFDAFKTFPDSVKKARQQFVKNFAPNGTNEQKFNFKEIFDLILDEIRMTAIDQYGGFKGKSQLKGGARESIKKFSSTIRTGSAEEEAIRNFDESIKKIEEGFSPGLDKAVKETSVAFDELTERLQKFNPAANFFALEAIIKSIEGERKKLLEIESRPLRKSRTTEDTVSKISKLPNEVFKHAKTIFKQIPLNQSSKNIQQAIESLKNQFPKARVRKAGTVFGKGGAESKQIIRIDIPRPSDVLQFLEKNRINGRNQPAQVKKSMVGNLLPESGVIAESGKVSSPFNKMSQKKEVEAKFKVDQLSLLKDIKGVLLNIDRKTLPSNKPTDKIPSVSDFFSGKISTFVDVAEL